MTLNPVVVSASTFKAMGMQETGLPVAGIFLSLLLVMGWTAK